MRTASPKAARNGQPWKRAEFLPPLDPASRQLEREADATIMVDEQAGYSGTAAAPARQPERREVARWPQ